MRLLLITREYPPHVKGGMSRIVEQMVKRHRKYGIDLTVIANHPRLSRSVEMIDGVTFHRVPSLGSTFLTQLPSFGISSSLLVKKLQCKYDVIYSNFSPLFCNFERPLIAGFQATRYGEHIACREIGKPVHALLNRLYIPFDSIIIKKADGIVALSDRMVEEIKNMGGKPEKINIIPNGVDTTIFRPLGVRRFDSREKIILYVGRLDARKGLDILLYAFGELTKFVNARLVLAGTGREEERLRSLADTLSLPVDFLGMVSQNRLPELYNSADLFVLPSLYEGLPLVLLEAMACGTPVAVSDASPDLGVPGFKRGSVGDLARLLLDIVPNENRLSNLSQNSLRLSGKYDWDHIVDHIFLFIRRFF